MRITKLLTAVGAAALAGTALVASTAAADATGQSTQLASVTVGTDLTVTVRAQRTGTSSANVYLAFSSHGSQWSERVPGDWFWYPLTGQGAVCEFGVTSRPGTKPVVDLSLLITPSIGCSDTLHYTVE
jgi:hypothetical protein